MSPSPVHLFLVDHDQDEYRRLRALLESMGDGYVLDWVPDLEQELQKRVNERTEELVRSEQAARRWSKQLQEVSRLAARLNAAHNYATVLDLITESARAIIDAQAGMAVLNMPSADNHPLTSLSFSDKYERWQQGRSRFGNEELDALVTIENRTIRFTQVELAALPQGRSAIEENDKRLALCGWLAVPLVGHDGTNLGLVQVTDKVEGDFTDADEAVLYQLALTASTAIENVQLYQDMRDRDRRKDEFLAMLAHELRNPLAPIRNAVEILELAKPKDASVITARELIARQVSHLVRLVDDLLDVSRITRGKINLIKVPVNLADVIAVAVESCRPLLDERKHTFALDLPAEPVHVRADLTRLAQVLLNLLNNAAKYTDLGGSIKLSVVKEQNIVAIQVSDNGPGIAPDMLPNIFDVFTQVDRTLDRSQGGLGLGLTLVRRLTEMHGGWVEAASAGLGKGSAFTVHLPLLADELTDVEKNEPLATGIIPYVHISGRILIVDDSIDSAESLAILLRARGYVVRTAYDGKKALAIADEFEPNAFILDIGLPGLDGYELARRLRAAPKSHDALLLALTGYGTEEDRRACFQVGFDAHFVKPVDLAALSALLASSHRTPR